MSSYPIVLTGPVRAVVIGGGAVAERKTLALLQAGADVRLVSPQVTPVLAQLARGGRISLLQRPYAAGDLAGALLAFAATDDREINAAVAADARQSRVLVNIADDPVGSTFHVPAMLRRGAITVSISTGGASPALAAHLRAELEQAVAPEYAALAELLAEARRQLHGQRGAGGQQSVGERPPVDERPRPDWDGLVTELLRLLRAGETDAAQDAVDRFVAQNLRASEISRDSR